MSLLMSPSPDIDRRDRRAHGDPEADDVVHLFDDAANTPELLRVRGRGASDFGTGDHLGGWRLVLIEASRVLEADLANDGRFQVRELGADHVLAGGPGAV